MTAITEMSEKILKEWLNDCSHNQIEDLCAKRFDVTDENIDEHDWIIFYAFLNACKTHGIDDEAERDAIFISIVDSFTPPPLQRGYTCTTSELRHMTDPVAQKELIYRQAEEFEDDLVRLNFDGDLTEKYVLDIPDTDWALHIDPSFTREEPERYTVKKREMTWKQEAGILTAEPATPATTPIACTKTDLSIPYFPDETRMKLSWFDEGKQHVEKFFDVEDSLYKETYASIPHFVSKTPKVDMTWFDIAKEFVKNNWVPVGDDMYAKPGSCHTKQGRFKQPMNVVTEVLAECVDRVVSEHSGVHEAL